MNASFAAALATEINLTFPHDPKHALRHSHIVEWLLDDADGRVSQLTGQLVAELTSNYTAHVARKEVTA